MGASSICRLSGRGSKRPGAAGGEKGRLSWRFWLCMADRTPASTHQNARSIVFFGIYRGSGETFEPSRSGDAYGWELTHRMDETGVMGRGGKRTRTKGGGAQRRSLWKRKGCLVGHPVGKPPRVTKKKGKERKKQDGVLERRQGQGGAPDRGIKRLELLKIPPGGGVSAPTTRGPIWLSSRTDAP